MDRAVRGHEIEKRGVGKGGGGCFEGCRMICILDHGTIVPRMNALLRISPPCPY